MSVRALYVDDEALIPGRGARKIQDLLRKEGELLCDLQLPPPTFSDLVAGLPDTFDTLLVDFDLSTPPADTLAPVSYYGSTLASEVRMHYPACPIVLITRPQLLGWKRELLEESIDVDLVLIKEDIIQDPDYQRQLIIALIEGFKKLAAIHGQDWQAVLQLMRAEEDEMDLLLEAAPPVFDKGQWSVPQTARWIRNVIIGFPGILYDDLTAATRLGISVESFNAPHVQELLAPAMYQGVFSNYGRRWWRGRLFRIAQMLMAKHQLWGAIAPLFREAYKAEYAKDLEPAVCVYDHTPSADWVCYVLKQPVKQQNSIPYYPDRRPSVMDQARVSFTAILESNAFDETLVDTDNYERVVKHLWK